MKTRIEKLEEKLEFHYEKLKYSPMEDKEKYSTKLKKYAQKYEKLTGKRYNFNERK
jgi:hypothetical protein|tara:strand:- start:14667 stop:14834 length:168 start_codon:yes stop_codon:yes gene_type:complete